MYQAATTFELDVPPERLLDVMWQVEHYAEFVRGVKKVELLSSAADVKRARFTATVAGLEFVYDVEVRRSAEEVTWKRVAGAFRDAGGAVRHLGGNRFRYENALDPGFAVPEFAVKFVLERSLPRLIREIKERAQALHART